MTTIKSSNKSKLDLFLGKHTATVVVAVLFIITLICFIIICVKDSLPENIVTGLFGLLGVLAGFFAGSNIKKED